MPLPHTQKWWLGVFCFFFFLPKPKQTCLICPPELPRGEKMHIGGVSKLVPLRAGISPVKTEWTAQMLSFILPSVHRLHFISHWSQQQKIKRPLLPWRESWGRGAAQPQRPVAGRGGEQRERARCWGGHRQLGLQQRFPCAPVSQGFGYIKTSWAKSSLRAGLVLAAVPGPWAPAESFSLERDAGSVVICFVVF